MNKYWKRLVAVLSLASICYIVFFVFIPVHLFETGSFGEGVMWRRNRLTNLKQTLTPLGWKNADEYVKWYKTEVELARGNFASLKLISPSRQWSPIILANNSDWNFKIDGSSIRIEYYYMDPDTKKRACLFSGQEGSQPDCIGSQQRVSLSTPSTAPATVLALPHKTPCEMETTIFSTTATNCQTGLIVRFRPPAANHTITATFTVN